VYDVAIEAWHLRCIGEWILGILHSPGLHPINIIPSFRVGKS
jgi:hypothetical protein